MPKTEDFLFEILTEELPPKSLKKLALSLQTEIENRLLKANLSFKKSQFFATPRRLAIFVKDVIAEQAAQKVERKGPAVSAAFDKDGNPTLACIGFAKSCGVDPKKLRVIKNPGGEWLGFSEVVPGKRTSTLLPAIIEQSLAALPIPKRMRWGSNDYTFIRPVHNIVLLLGKNVVKANILGHAATRFTLGHRFHHPKKIKILRAKDYETLLEKKGHVIVDFEKRQKKLVKLAQALVKRKLGKDLKILFQPDLLDEVTGLIEWPVAICGEFASRFLDLPSPVLISAMQDHQRYFPIVDKNKNLLPHFAAIVNIESRKTQQVIAGNERVLRARLADADFFYAEDKKILLKERVDALKGIIFQAKLGTLYDKTQRLIQISNFIARKLQQDAALSARAALLAKADLTTQMVNEFPELQGMMGNYYALDSGEPAVVAQAIMEQYNPRFSGDVLPQSVLGSILALADRVDTLVGVFGINQIPTGDKDPFGLRRAAVGVLRILIETKIDIDLLSLLNYAASCFVHLENKEVSKLVLSFIQERLKAWYQEQGITPDVFAAVSALNLTRPYDIHRRIQAVQAFRKLPDAQSLAAANKRVSNILSQYTHAIMGDNIDANLFDDDREKILATSLVQQSKKIEPLFASANYGEVLSELANLRRPIDNFFDHVLVMTDDKEKRENRLLMLSRLRQLFLQVADIALLVIEEPKK